MSEDNIWKRIEQMSPKPLYFLLILIIAGSFLVPMPFPINISEWTQSAYEFTDSLPPGSVILAPNVIEASCWGECGYGWIATWQHYFENDYRVVALSLYKDGPLLCERVIDELESRGVQIEYGVNYVNLGFIAGINSAIAALVEPPDGLHKVVSTDYFGNSIDTLPLMDEVRCIDQVDLIASISSGWGEDWVGLAVIPYGAKYMYSIIGAGTPWLINEYDLGLAVGGLGGLKGGAEYEILLGRPGIAVKSMNAISTTHVLIILAIIIGNVAMYMSRRSEG